jgi:hypothetical protein
MPKLCLVKTKLKKSTGSDEMKEAINDAESVFENNIKAFFSAASTILLNENKQDFLKNLKQQSKAVKVECILTIFMAKGFKEIGTSKLFEEDENEKLKYPEAVCVIENCLSSFNYTNDEIAEVVSKFMEIKYMWERAQAGYNVKGTLPIYNLNPKSAETHRLYRVDNNYILERLIDLVS